MLTELLNKTLKTFSTMSTQKKKAKFSVHYFIDGAEQDLKLATIVDTTIVGKTEIRVVELTEISKGFFGTKSVTVIPVTVWDIDKIKSIIDNPEKFVEVEK